MDNRGALPSLIATLSKYEKGQGVFDKKLSNDLAKTSAEVRKGHFQQVSSDDDEVHGNDEELYDEEIEGVNSYAEYTRKVQEQGIEDYSQSVSAPGTTRDYAKMRRASVVAQHKAMPDYIKEFKKEWEYVTENRLRLPMIRQLSPRTRKKVSLLPPPNELDLKKVASFEKITADGVTPVLYSNLQDSAVREQMRNMRKGVFTMQDTSKPRPSSSNKSKRNKYNDDTPIQISHDSTSYFDDVRERQIRYRQQESRVKGMVGGDEDEVSESSSMPAVRPASPKLASYPFHTSLTTFLGREKQTMNAKNGSPLRVRSGSEYSLVSQQSSESAMKGRQPPALAVAKVDAAGDTDLSSVRSSTSMSSTNTTGNTKKILAKSKASVGAPDPGIATLNSESLKLLHSVHPPTDPRVIQSQYAPVLDEVTAAANEALHSYDSVAQKYDKNKQRLHKKKYRDETFLGNWKTALLEEIGLDIDPAHSIRVKYGKAISLVMYYLVMVKLKYATAIWKDFTRKTSRARRERAASLITRVSKGVLARRMVTEIRINRERQRQAEEEHARQMRAFRNFLSRRIARAWLRHRKYEAKKLKRLQFTSARCIQRHARGMIGRAYAIWFRRYRENCKISATKFQSVWRMYKARRRVTLMRKMEYVRQWELSRAEKQMLTRLNYKHHGAAITLGRAYRAHTIHVRLQELLYWNRFKRAFQIQCVYRGYVVRKMYYKLALAKAKKERERADAATVIQSQVRLWRCLKAYSDMTAGKREKDERRKRRKRKKLRDLVISFSEESSWNISATKRALRRGTRNMMPFRYVFERVKARTIQRYWRGYRARKRTLVMTVHKKVNEVYAKRAKKEQSAIKIQKVFRGHRRRHTMRKEVWKRMATRIQCYWRRRAARRFVSKLKDKIIARAILSDKLTALVIGNRVRKQYKLEKMYRRHVCRIQRRARRYIGRKIRRDLKDTLRVREEGSGSASLTTLRIMTQVQLMILRECMGREIGVKPRPVSGVQCPCYGPPQAMFVSALGKKGRPDPDLLAANRLDTTTAQKLMAKVEAMYAIDKREREKRTKEERALLKPVPPDATELQVLKAIKVGIVALPRITKQLGASDVDIMFNRFKGTAGGNQLLFSEFCEFLRGIGEFVFAKILVSRTISHAESFDDMFAPSPVEKVSAAPAVIIRQTSSIGRPQPRATSPGPTDRAQSPAAGTRPTSQQSRRNKKRNFISIRAAIAKYLFPFENLIVNQESLGLATLLYLMMATEREEWVKGASDWLALESHARVSSIIVPIQQMIRRKLACVRTRKRRIEKAEEDRVSGTMNRVRIVQRVIRGKLNWLRAVKIAQEVLVKYIPHKGNPYWYNPRTRVSTYVKPKILGSFDCVEIALPAPKMEYVVICGTCESQPATVNCNECEDSMCKSCFATMHCKGKKKKHSYQLIQFCSVCKYQCATKSCATCSLRKPKPRSVMELVKGDRGVQCDSCYTHLHENTIASETGLKKNTTSSLREDSREAYLVGQALNQRLDTDHRYQSLVQVCEECNWRAATYRCADCDQIYCNKCLTGFHSMGGPFSKHSAEKLPYYTPEMHKKFEKAMFEQRLQKRIEKVSQVYARRAHELRVRSAIKVQSWWRMIVGGFKGRAFMKEKRQKIRKMARLRKYEDYTYRRTVVYQIRNICGLTPKLASDTLEERILGKHNIFIRQRLREYIWRNCDDFGYMHNFSKKRGDEELLPKERKGEPRTGFNSGTPKELADQAKNGGYRLPGRIDMKRGEKEHVVSMDISPLLKRGQYIRIKNCFFVINSVGKDNKVTFNRRWRFKDAKKCVIYLMPCYPGEPYKWFYKGKIMLFDLAVGNVLSQLGMQAYNFIWQHAADKAQAVSTANKRQGNMVVAKKWSKKADKRLDKALWSSNLIFDDGAPDTASLDTGGKSTIPGSKGRRPEDRVPGEPWEATEEEKNARYVQELKMSRADLAAEAPIWEENFDPMKNKNFWINSKTLEMTYEMPKAVLTKNEMDEEAEAKRKEFAETQRKIARLAKEKTQKKTLGKKKK